MAQYVAENDQARTDLINKLLENKSMCDESREILKDPNIFCIIQRSKNSNIVVYKANLDNNGSFIEDNPISVFWLKIEPSYVAKHRKQGKKDDKTELTYMESNMAFGISWEKLDTKNEYQVTFVALKQRKVILKLNKDGIPRCFGKVNNNDVYLVSMFVDTSENWVGLPKVNHIEMIATRIDNGQTVTEKIKP